MLLIPLPAIRNRACSAIGRGKGDYYTLHDELVTTTEHTEHTEKEPNSLKSSFRELRVFRGSIIGSGTNREAGVKCQCV